MRYFAIIAVLLLSLSASSCTPNDNALPAPPASENPGDDNGTDNPDNPPSTSRTMKITVGSTVFTATLVDNATVAAFKAMLPLTLNMNDFNSNEKVCSLPNSLPVAASNPGSIRTGDIMLYGSNSLVLFYETFSTSYSYTRIGQVDNPAELKAALGQGNITIKFELQ